MEKGDALGFMSQIEEGASLISSFAIRPSSRPSRRLSEGRRQLHAHKQIGHGLRGPAAYSSPARSAAMTQQPEIFRAMLQDAARKAGVEVTILSTTGAAPCHAVHPAYPQGAYLTAVLCSVTRPGEDSHPQ